MVRLGMGILHWLVLLERREDLLIIGNACIECKSRVFLLQRWFDPYLLFTPLRLCLPSLSASGNRNIKQDYLS